MRPELFSLPFFHLSFKSYGLMMVLGFLAGLWLARRRSKKVGENPEEISSIALWALILGVIGARAMHVIHNWWAYRDNPREIFAVWSGGLELLGGVILGSLVLTIYFVARKRPALNILDILAPSLMIGIAIGRVGCLLNGCCYGNVCELPWAIEFPAINVLTQASFGGEKKEFLRYSPPYEYQLAPDSQRRPGDDPYLILPDGYYAGYMDSQNRWYPSRAEVPDGVEVFRAPKSPGQLSETQREALRSGKFPMHRVHPAQLYSTLNALGLCLILNFLFNRRKYRGQIIAWMLVLYGLTRTGLEFLRSDSPLEFDGLTISQNLGLLAALTGIVLILILRKRAFLSDKGVVS